MKALIPLASIVLIAAAVAQTSQKPILSSQNLKIYAKNWSSEAIGENKFRFTAEGNPFSAVSDLDGRTIQAQKAVGDVIRSTNGGITLDAATLTGGIYVKQVKPSESGIKDAVSTTELRSTSAEYTRSGEQWVLHGGIAVDQEDPSISRVVNIKGREATVGLFGDDRPKQTRFPVKTGTISGNVTFLIKGRYRSTDEKTKATTWEKFTTHGNADKMVFNEAAGTLTLIGNVVVKGDAPVFIGDMTGSKITITFDANGKPVKVEGEADDKPGTTVIKTKPPAATLLYGRDSQATIGGLLED
ncbi:MAG: hypothetical protein KF784_05400 [Fimbriimonadaceae bacterium]|nr:hypothetical protein [Fimbriimonadaceae bacterium]